MGYFRKPIRRQQARRAVEAHIQPTREVDPSRWTAPPENPDQLAKYVRLRIDFGYGPLRGLFRGGDRIAVDIETPIDIRQRMERQFKWFNRHLPIPRGVEPDAVYWFVFEDRRMIARAWELVHAIQDAGYKVLLEATDTPGRIVYRDAYQVGAIRFTDAPAIRPASVVLERAAAREVENRRRESDDLDSDHSL